jgi:hypothetical protein
MENGGLAKPGDSGDRVSGLSSMADIEALCEVEDGRRRRDLWLVYSGDGQKLRARPTPS